MEVNDSRNGFVVLAGTSHPELAKMIANRLACRLGECNVHLKPNQETSVDIKQSVRNKDVFIIQTGTRNVNNDIMELMIMIYGVSTSCARSVNVIMPYMPYSKQCKMWRRSAIAGKLVADMICTAGATRFITMDLYRKELQGFFSVPVDNLRASIFLLQYIKEKIPDYKNAVIVAKNPDRLNKATSFAERLRLGIAVVHGEPKEGGIDSVDGRASPPPLDSAATPSGGGHTDSLALRLHAPVEFLPTLVAKEKPPLTVVGDVGGRIAIMVDDMIDEVASFVAAADVLKERGAYKIYVVATHGVLSGDAPGLLEESHIDEVVVTNTVPHELQKMQCHKIKTVDVSVMFSEAIRRIYHNESMSYLFRDVALED